MSLEDSLRSIQELLLQTISPDNAIRKNAETYLQGLAAQSGFLISLLELISRLSNSVDATSLSTRKSAAVFFKNTVKRRWNPDEDSNEAPIAYNDRETIKMHLIDIMCSTSPDVQKQLAEAVSIIAKYDFPTKWSGLLPHLVSKLSSPDLNIRKGVMITANSIMKRYRYTYKSDALFAEILDCLNGFQVPLLETYKLNIQTIQSLVNNKTDLIIAMETHRLMTRIFFSLNWQELPEFFEDHIKEWMESFAMFLTYKNPLLVDSNEESEPGSIELLQTAIIENLNLYAMKYEEEFSPFLSTFTQMIWQLLIEVGIQPKYDTLISNAIKFLTSVCSKQMNISLFTDSILKDIIEYIVIRNLQITELDEESFEDNGIDYIRKDYEGGDQDTRRRSAIELVRALMKFFTTQITTLCIQYITILLEQYRTTNDWKAKDTALHLLLAVSVTSTNVSAGPSTLNPNINILDMFNTHILPELHDTKINDKPVVKADVIKLVCYFRTHLQTSFLLSVLPHIVRHLNSKYLVVQTYAAICIEKFLTIKDKNPATDENVPRIKKEDLVPHLEAVFTGLFNVLDNTELPENEYVMKCILKVMSVLGTDMLPIVTPIVNKLSTLLARICAKPVNPHFNHYLFECLAVLVKSICIDSPPDIALPACSNFEVLLFPPFQTILSTDITDFIPYVFQVLALLLSARPVGSGLSEAYQSLFPPLLSPVLWKQKGYIPALSDLFKAYITVGMSTIVNGNHIEAVLGIFQELLASKTNEIYAFKLINQLYTFNKIDILSPYLRTIFDLLLRRMQSQMTPTFKTPKYCRLFIHSMFLFATVYDANILYTTLQSLFDGLINELIGNVWSHNKVLCCQLDYLDIQYIIVGCTKVLCESPVTTNPTLWSITLKNLIPLLDAKGLQKIEIDDTFLLNEDADDREYDTKYSKLIYAHVPDMIIHTEIKQSKIYFLNQLSNLFKSAPGKYLSLIQQALVPEEMTILQTLVQQHNITLV